MMGVSSFGAAVLYSVEALFPVMTFVKTTTAHLVFVDDFPLVLGAGVFQPKAVGGRVFVVATVFGAPSTPQFV